jgi:GT2 family glycosyltransferase
VVSLSQQTVVPRRIIVVDNASTDSSLADIENIHPAIEMIHAPSNLGFARANNLALAHVADLQWTVLLNPDAIAEPTWLEKLLDVAESNREYSFFASKMIDALSPELLDGCGDIVHFSGLAWRRWHGSPVTTCKGKTEECFAVCAGAGMYATGALKMIGGFDEHFFCYCEDVDLSFRLQLQGLRCLYVADAVVFHAGAISSGGKQSDFSVYHGHRNLVWTYVKNMPGWLFYLCLPAHIGLNVVEVIWFTFQGRAKIILRSKRDAILGLPKVWGERAKIQKNRVVTSLEIWRKLDKRLFWGCRR